MAQRMGLVPGMPLDLTTVDPDEGKPWDFNDDAKARKAEWLSRNQQAMLLIGSTMCTAFNQLQYIKFAKMND